MTTLLKYHGLAEEICREAYDSYRAELSAYQLRCEASLTYGDLSAVLAGRFGVLEFMSAAHYLKDASAFMASCDALLCHIEALVKQFRWAPEIAAVELSLALMTGRIELAQTLARSIIDGPISTNPHIERFQAETLAAMVIGDYTHALRVVADLLDFIDTEKLSKLEREQGLHWSDALKHICTDDSLLADASIDQLEAVNGRQVNGELTKIMRGAESALSPFDLFDYARLGLSAWYSRSTLEPSI
jgi:hypothetical protein